MCCCYIPFCTGCKRHVRKSTKLGLCQALPNDAATEACVAPYRGIVAPSNGVQNALWEDWSLMPNALFHVTASLASGACPRGYPSIKYRSGMRIAAATRLRCQAGLSQLPQQNQLKGEYQVLQLFGSQGQYLADRSSFLQ